MARPLRCCRRHEPADSFCCRFGYAFAMLPMPKLPPLPLSAAAGQAFAIFASRLRQMFQQAAFQLYFSLLPLSSRFSAMVFRCHCYRQIIIDIDTTLRHATYAASQLPPAPHAAPAAAADAAPPPLPILIFS
jgi:hypothetical protein